MPFVKVPGLPGKLYIPEMQKNCRKKQPCEDCYSCEHCSDNRCRVCRDNRASKRDKSHVDDDKKRVRNKRETPSA